MTEGACFTRTARATNLGGRRSGHAVCCLGATNGSARDGSWPSKLRGGLERKFWSKPSKSLLEAKPRGFFPDSGALFLWNERLALQMDCGPFGYGGAGHSHADTL